MNMTTTRRSAGSGGWAAGLAALLVLAGCAAGTRPPQAEEAAVGKPAPSGTVLAYKMPADQVLRYTDESEVREVTDAMGQVSESLAKSAASYAFQGRGKKGQDLLVGVTVDDMTLNISSPSGDVSPDMTEVNGRSFDMVLSPRGTKVDVSGAEAITYDLPNGPRSIAPGLKVFFPQLPDKPVKVGDSWPSSFVVEEKAGGVDMRIGIQSVNTLEGFETVDGLACARVSSKHTGTITGTGNQQGTDLAFNGAVNGSDIWYFAPAPGLYVGSEGQVVSEISVTVVGPQSMTIPVTQTRKSKVRLIGH
jgi:hypothetical protein